MLASEKVLEWEQRGSVHTFPSLLLYAHRNRGLFWSLGYAATGRDYWDAEAAKADEVGLGGGLWVGAPVGFEDGRSCSLTDCINIAQQHATSHSFKHSPKPASMQIWAVYISFHPMISTLPFSQPWLTKFVQHPGTTTKSTTWASIELNLSIICACLPILRNPLRIICSRMVGTTVKNTANATIGSSHHRSDPSKEESNGTSNTRMMESSKLRLDGCENNGTSGKTRTSLLSLDNAAVSHFVGSRGREMIR